MIRILSDSTCDLSKDLISRYNIEIIPLFVRLGEAEYLDGVNITPKQLYAWSDECGQTPQTAAPGIEDIMKVLNGNDDDEFIIFTISSPMSACYNNCILASEELGITDRVHVIDSQNLSTGIGLLIIEAAIMRSNGCSAGEIESYIINLRSKVRASFVVDTLTYLYRGGRCSGLAAMVGNTLKLHPRIAVVDGQMRPEQKYRGKPQKFVMDYVKDMEKNFLTAKSDRVFITHSGCSEEILKMVSDYLTGLGYFKEILITRAGSVISSHCGPGTLGVLFIDNKN
ncbi:MAG: DegV family protein [Lachnospiraceae bacterium]|nr:DegV family protein [Lachnospiraceae bacterium]